jgi:hypothetical protein
MGKQSKLILIILLVASVLAIGQILGTAFARDKAAAADPQDKRLLTSDQIKLLLLLMDTNKDGKISKQEWMSFMGTEFDKLDKDRSGEIGPKELARLSLQSNTFARTGK